MVFQWLARPSNAAGEREFREECVFCRIATGKEPPANNKELLFKDERMVAFEDIRPAARCHYQVIPVQHIRSVRQVGPADLQLLRDMLRLGEALLHKDAPGAETRFGFHVPPFNSVNHLHLHCLALPFKPAWKDRKYQDWGCGLFHTYLPAEELITQLEIQGLEQQLSAAQSRL